MAVEPLVEAFEGRPGLVDGVECKLLSLRLSVNKRRLSGARTQRWGAPSGSADPFDFQL